jgi:bifunctional polynucleotide phosphatase/kinase
MAPVVIKLNNPRHRQKMACFDYDHTLVKPKQGRKFPKDENDWQWYTDAVPYTLRKYYDQGYGIYVFTNQTKDWKQQHILNSLDTLNIPMTIVIAYNLAEHKPNPSIFHTVLEGKKWKPEESFFVGDALGRPGDFADSDKKFAENIGVDVKSPDDVFGMDKDTNGRAVLWYNSKLEDALEKVAPSKAQEIVIMVGYPGSGKSTIAEHLEKQGYFVVNGDKHKTDASRVKVGTNELDKGMSVVFDATNLTQEKRAIYINLAKEKKIPSRCIFVATSLERSLERNLQRPEGKRVPPVAYYKMQKTFEAPSSYEGCALLTI